MEHVGGTISCATYVSRYLASMDWQQLVSLAVVAAAAVMLLGRNLNRRKFSFERDTHCGCGPVWGDSCPPSIVFHARKGERAEVRVKMR